MKLSCILVFFLIGLARGTDACTNHPPYAWAELTVPEIEFKDASLNDVAAFFNAFMARSLTNQPAPRISLVPDVGETGHAVTFSARFIRIGCAIKVISAVCGLTYTTSESGIVLQPMKLEDGKGHDLKGFTTDAPFAAPSRTR